MTNIATIAFFASFAGIISMISMKYFELKTGRKIWFALLAEKHDHIVHKAHGRVRKFFSYFSKHNIILLVQWLAVRLQSQNSFPK